MTPSGDLFGSVTQEVEQSAHLELRLGPLALPTTTTDLKRALGQQLTTDGPIVAPRERQPRSFTPKIPLHGEPGDVDPYQTGLRLRRQVAALINNQAVMAHGTFFDFGPDPWMRLWLQIGAASVSYTEAGITFADFALEITDAYEIATAETHRCGRQFAVADRRKATTPRDTLATIYSTNYAALAPLALAGVPTGMVDPALMDWQPAGTRLAGLAARDGTRYLMVAPAHLETITFEAPTNLYSNSVRILDRRGFLTAPVPGDDAGWETVYGPSQKLTSGDPPVIDNGLCRARWNTQGLVAGYSIDAWTTGGWEEQLKVYGLHALAGLDVLLDHRVLEWTPERAVISLTLGSTGTAQARDTLLVTLQRGWTAPRLQLYPVGTVAVSGLAFSTRPQDTAVSWTSTDATVTDTTGPVNNVGTGFAYSNTGRMTRTGRPLTVQFAVQLTSCMFGTRRTTLAYGTNAWETIITGSTVNYYGVHVGLGSSVANTPAGHGAADHGAAALMDAQAIPILVAR